MNKGPAWMRTQGGVEGGRSHGGVDLMEDTLGTTDDDAATKDGDTGGAVAIQMVLKTEVEPWHRDGGTVDKGRAMGRVEPDGAKGADRMMSDQV